MAYLNSYKNQNWLIPRSIKDMIPKEQPTKQEEKQLATPEGSPGEIQTVKN